MRLLSETPIGRSFVAKELRWAKVAWLNSEWFDSCDIGELAAATYEHRSSWLLSNFAFAVPSPNDHSEGAYGTSERVFFADSYGETGKVFHGGSARAGTIQGFQVKGIGVTPLVGIYADPLHSHGSAWFEEGVREVIYAEVFGRELPWGAVPVVALIDTGIHSRSDRASLERRVLIIRPFVFRPSHAQRAMMFRPASGVRHAQLADANRTRLIVELLQTSPTVLGAPTEDGIFKPELLLRRIAEQIAYCEANRLTHGGFLASNLALDGRVLDFGAARSLPSWASVSLLPGLPGFGRDGELIADLIESLSFYLSKYAVSASFPLRSELLEGFRHSLENARRCELLRLWGPEVSKLDSSSQELIYAQTLELFMTYQRSCSTVQALNKVDATWQSSINSLVSVVRQSVSAEEDDEPLDSIIKHFKRSTLTRSDIFREPLQERILNSVCPLSDDQTFDPMHLRQFIKDVVDNNTLLRF